MKFFVDAKKLQNALTEHLFIIEKKALQMALQSTLFQLTGNKLTLYSTDLQVSYKTTMTVVGEEDGVAGMNTSELYKIVKELKGRVLFQTAEEEHIIKITANYGLFSCTIDTMAEEHFPEQFQQQEDDYVFVCKGLQDSFDSTLFAAHIDENNRGNLCGLLLRYYAESGELRIVGTNGSLLALYKISIELEPPPILNDSGIIIPTKGGQAFLKCFNNSDDIKISISEKTITFSDGNKNLQVWLREGVFPDYERVVVPKEEIKMVATVEKDALLQKVKQLLALRSEGCEGGKFEFDAEGVSITIYNPSIGNAQDKLSVEYSQKQGDITIGLNLYKLKDVLSHIKNEKLKILVKDSFHPIIIEPEPESLFAVKPKFFVVIMGMRLSF